MDDNDDVVSLTPSEIDRQLEEEMQQQLAEEVAKMQNNNNNVQVLDDDQDGGGGDYGRNREFDQSHTSFKSMMSHATVMTMHE